jgi:WRKY transcription factor 33
MRFCTFQIFPSPTTNAFASQQFSWLTTPGAEQGVKEEQRQSYPDFSFQTAPTTQEAVRTTTTFQPPIPAAPLVRSASIICVITLSWALC